MPEFKAGRAYIEVGPSLKGFRRKTEADLKSELAGAGESAGERLGKNIADGAERGASGAGRRSADQFAGEFDRQVRTRIKAALKSLPEAKIGASTNEAEQKIRDLREKLVTLSDQRIGIDVDAVEAVAELESIQREMASIDGQQLSIDARVNAAAAMMELDKLKIKADEATGDVTINADADTAKAEAQLDRLKAKADRVNGQRVNIRADADTSSAEAGLAALAAQAASTGGGINSLWLSLAALAPALIPLAAVGVPVIAGIGAAAVGAAGGVGVLGAALAPVVGAVRALGAADTASAKDSAAAAEVRLSAMQRVSDAQDRVTQVREQGAQRVSQAARTVQDAEARLASAQRDSLTAQQEINAAREDARRTLQDLALDLSGAQLRERGAALSVQEAQNALAKVMADPRSTELERKRAQLALDDAKQSLAEIQVRTKRLAADKAKADKKGVEGSDAVTAAQTRARDAASKVKSAERDLADARTAQAKAQRDASRDNARASRDLARAQDALTRSMSKTSSSVDKVQAAMKNLSPEGRAFARWVYSLKGGLVDLSKIAQRGFLPGLQDGLQQSSIYAGLLKDTVGKLSTVLGNLARDAGKALTGPFWKGFIQFLAAKSPGWLDTLGRTLGAAATGIAALFKALSPLIDMMGGGALDMMERFSAWAQGLGDNKGFQSFLAYVKENGPKVADFLGALWGALTNIVIALAPFGTGILDKLTSGLDWIAKQDPEKIRAVATSILAVAGGMKALSTAAGIVSTLASLGPFGLIAAGVLAVAGSLVYLYQTNSDFKKKVDEAWDGIKAKIDSVVTWLQDFWAQHGAAIKANWDEIWGSIQDTFSSVWTSIQDIARSVGGWLQLFWQEWGDRLKEYFAVIWASIRYIIDGALQVIRGIFEVFAGLFTGDWERLWNGFTEIFNGAAKVLYGVIRAGVENIKLYLQLAWAAIKTVGEKAWNGIVSAFGAIWDGIVSAISGPIDRVMQFIQENLIDKINGLFTFLKIPLHIEPIWKPSNVGTGMVKAGREYTKGYREGGYTGNRGVNQVAGVVHGREFVFDAATTAAAGGARALEAVREAIRGGWKPAGYRAGGYVNPVGRPPSFPWGRYPSGGRHPAYDYAVPIGTPVRSPYSGTVIRDGWDTTGYGTSIRGRSDSGIFFVLGHLLREMVSVGQHVLAGQLVGYSGNTGHSSGPHLHFGTSTTPNMIGPGAFNPDTGGGTPGGSGGGSFFSSFVSNALTAGINGFVGLVSGGLSRFGVFGQVLGGVVSALGTGAANLGLRLLGLDTGGQVPGVPEGGREVRPLLFDSGGILPTGISIVKNATGRPEPLMRMNGPDSPPMRWHPDDVKALVAAVEAGAERGTTRGAHRGLSDQARELAIGAF